MNANIPDEHRNIFRRYGENVVGLVLAGGFTPTAKELQPPYVDQQVMLYARDWLTERADKHAFRELRLEILEWAIVVLILVEILRPCMH